VSADARWIRARIGASLRLVTSRSHDNACHDRFPALSLGLLIARDLAGDGTGSSRAQSEAIGAIRGQIAP